MSDKVSAQDWDQWRSNPITKIFKNYLERTQNEAIETLLNTDPASFDSIDSYAMRCATLRSFIDGMAQTTDFDSIEESIVESNPDEEQKPNGY
jgi:hypothetical protein